MLLASATTLPVVLAASGCRSAEAFAGPDPLAGPSPPSPEVITLEAVITAEANLIQAYKTAISGDSRAAGHPGDLATLLAQHEQHLAQLRARLVLPPGRGGLGGRGGRGGLGGTASPQDRGAPGRPPGQAHPPGPAHPSGPAHPPGSAQLRAAERASAAYLVRQLGAAEPGIAQLFASIAACHATHVAALGG
jgi:hypothetical protein